MTWLRFLKHCFGRAVLARAVVLVLLLSSGIQGAVAVTMPSCAHAARTAMADLPEDHAAMGHAADAGGEMSTQDADPVGADCQQCAVCHLACSGTGLAVALQTVSALAGADAPADCAGGDCPSHVAETPHRPPRFDR